MEALRAALLELSSIRACPFADRSTVRILHRDDRKGGLNGWEVDRTTDLAVEKARGWIGDHGLAVTAAPWDIALVEISDRPSARTAAELAGLARRAPLAVRLWEAIRRPWAPEQQEDHLRFVLSVAHLVIVEDRGHLVRLASRVDVDPRRVALCAAEYGLAAPGGDGVADLREGLDRGQLAGARVVVTTDPTAGFADAVLRSGRGLVAVGAERPLASNAGARVHLLDGDAEGPDVGAAVELAARASRAAAARPLPGDDAVPGWWQHLEGARAALDPQHG